MPAALRVGGAGEGLPRMDPKATNIVSAECLHFLRMAYRFISEEWSHAVREPIPDRGFEEAFRTMCVTKLQSWRISQIREMNLGQNLESASGILHEIDLVGIHESVSVAAELKNWTGTLPGKNEVVVFFAKLFDYFAANPSLMLHDFCPLFLSAMGFDESGLAACVGLGIHPMAPGLRPLPIVVDSAQRMDAEIRRGLNVGVELSERLADLWGVTEQLCRQVDVTWLSSRCGYLSETSIAVKAILCPDAIGLARTLREVNGLCDQLLGEFRIQMRLAKA